MACVNEVFSLNILLVYLAGHPWGRALRVWRVPLATNHHENSELKVETVVNLCTPC